MKQKRPERVERRRPLVEMNMISERARPRSVRKLSGIAPALARLTGLGKAGRRDRPTKDGTAA